MYTPIQFRVEDLPTLHAIMRDSRLANLVTSGTDGLVATPLPLMIDPSAGPYGTLYGHLARANPQWRDAGEAEALAIFMGPDAYVTPSWYATKRETGKVVPTWNYVSVHAYGRPEFFEDAGKLRDVVGRLTDLYEKPRAESWKVEDAPEPFVQAQLRAIVGFQMPIARLEGKRKMSQNRNEADRAGVAAGLGESDRPSDRHVATMIPT